MVRSFSFGTVLLFAALSLFSQSVFTSFELEQENAAVAAGTPVTTRVSFECAEGYILAGWSSSVVRKNAPKEFFEKPGLAIRPHKTAHDYDSVLFSDYLHFQTAMKSGRFLVILPTAGLSEGDYAIGIIGRFMKDKKSFYAGKTFYLTITEGAKPEVPFAKMPQNQPLEALKPGPVSDSLKSFEVTPSKPEVKAGEKISMTVKFAFKEGTCKAIGGYVNLLRKNAPAGCFDREGFSFERHRTSRDYDVFKVVPLRKYPNGPVVEGTDTFEIDTTGYPAGTYLFSYQIYAKDASGKTVYGGTTIPVGIY